MDCAEAMQHLSNHFVTSGDSVLSEAWSIFTKDYAGKIRHIDELKQRNINLVNEMTVLKGELQTTEACFNAASRKLNLCEQFFALMNGVINEKG